MTTLFQNDSDLLLNLAKSMFLTNTIEGSVSSGLGCSAISFSITNSKDSEIDKLKYFEKQFKSKADKENQLGLFDISSFNEQIDDEAGLELKFPQNFTMIDKRFQSFNLLSQQ